MLKVLTLPVWILPWVVVNLFKARAVMRAGRRVYPVRCRHS